MRAASESYTSEKLVILSVSIQESNGVVENFINQHRLSSPFVLDPSGEVSSRYNIFSTPTTFFIDPDGVIVDVSIGVLTEQWINRNMAAFEG